MLAAIAESIKVVSEGTTSGSTLLQNRTAIS
jgi:hypothetical protein